jgi:hypothetical protein
VKDIYQKLAKSVVSSNPRGKRTWNLRHPIVPLATKELALWRQIRRLVERPVEDVNEISRIRLFFSQSTSQVWVCRAILIWTYTILQQRTPTLNAKLPMQQCPGPVVRLMGLYVLLALGDSETALGNLCCHAEWSTGEFLWRRGKLNCQ